jgi:hypothetical protein
MAQVGGGVNDRALIVAVLGLNVANVVLALIRTGIHLEKRRAWKAKSN